MLGSILPPDNTIATFLPEMSIFLSNKAAKPTARPLHIVPRSDPYRTPDSRGEYGELILCPEFERQREA